MLSAEERARVEEAIREAERDTAGEIAVVLAGQAAGYHSVPLIWGLVLALLVPWPLVAFTTFRPGTIYILQLLVALVAIPLLAWPGRRHALVPGAVSRGRAREAAMREFVGRGLTRTRERLGVLIYVAEAERHVEIVTDTGLTDRVEAGAFDAIRRRLSQAVAGGRAAEGLVTAVGEVGRVLAAHAPPQPDDWDELPNKVVVI
jgi:putative membrane protein